MLDGILYIAVCKGKGRSLPIPEVAQVWHGETCVCATVEAARGTNTLHAHFYQCVSTHWRQ